VKQFDIGNLFPFQSSNIDIDELEKIIKDAVRKEHPLQTISEIEYTEDGVAVTLDNGQEIDIDIDWDEIILS
jgi:predicted small metal-binding protein